MIKKMFLIKSFRCVNRIPKEEANKQTQEKVIVSLSNPDPQKKTEGTKKREMANSFDSLGNSRKKN